MKIYECEQRTPEWYQARLGKITASCLSDVMSKGTGRNTYMFRLAAERLTGLPQDSYTNGAMQWGIDTEPHARAFYEELNNTPVKQVGFVELTEDLGMSPDGLVNDDGILEIKCPNTTTHIANILRGKLPSEYVPQVQGGLWITGRKFCDFVSFDPRMQKKKFHCIRVERDDDKIEEIIEATSLFIAELKELIEKINKDPF